MIKFIFVIAFSITQPTTLKEMVATEPKELKLPIRTKIKRSRGKGKGKIPYFMKYM